MKSIIVIFVIASLFSCQRNESKKQGSYFLGVGVEPSVFSVNSETHTDYISDWDLRIVYNFSGSESTAYLKFVGKRCYVFPFSWDLYNNTDGDPTDKETYIELPLGEINAVFVDVLYLSIAFNPVIAVHVVFENETQWFSIFQFDSDQRDSNPIFSLESTGYINLESRGRDDIEIRNDEPLLEGVRRIQYRYQDGVFVVDSPVILDKKTAFQFNDVLSLSTKQDQINALKGPWVYIRKLEGSIFTPSNFEKLGVIVNFMPETRRVVFSQNDMAEIFVWRGSSKLLQGLLTSFESLFESKIVQSTIIRFVSQDEIHLRFRGDMIWSGVYKRMTQDERAERIMKQNRLLNRDDFELSGTYSSGQGHEFIFSYPEVRIRKEMEKKKFEEILGTYAIFRVNKQDILEIRLLDQNQQFKERRIFDFVENDRVVDQERIVRSFRITPGDLYTYGVVTMGERPMIFEKISSLGE